jgi:fatty-acyl-CoA synthase
VADAVCGWHQVRDASVYGVRVPGHDGRAGMVAIVSDGALDLDSFLKHITTRLPEYARPVFVRVLAEIETTGTFKPKKQDLVRVGFDPNQTPDALFMHHREANAFVPLDATLFERIESCRVRL